MLYLIATPIGNLSDFTFRAIETIASCDYLLCEDTRRSRILLNHYKLDKPLVSYHKFSEEKKKEGVIQDLLDGKTVGLISDAGTPCLADPGARLVAACHEHHIKVVPIPGCSAPIVAMSASGFEATNFQFVSFLPKKTKHLKEMLAQLLEYDGTSICFESPFRVKETLKILNQLAPDRLLIIGREMTKKFETFYRGSASELTTLWKEKPPKGEIVLLISNQKSQLPVSL